MEVKVYKRKPDSSVEDLLESLNEKTDLVRLEASDYEEPLKYKLDFEDRIIMGKDDILNNPNKVLGIIDIELFWKSSGYYGAFDKGDLVDTPFGLFIKRDNGYTKAEIK